MKKATLLLSLLFAVLLSKAQTSIAITGGLHNSSITPAFLVYPDTLLKKSASKIGVSLGFTAKMPLHEKLFFQTGVIYATTGSDWTQFYDTTNLYYRTANLTGDKKIKKYSVNTKLSLQYINVPLNVMYQLPIKGNTSFVLGGGPQVSVFFNGKINTKTVSVSQDSLSASSVRIYTKEGENNDLLIGKSEARFRVVHFAVNAFAGFEFRKAYLRINYDRDLNEFYGEEGRQYKSATLGIRFGVYFGHGEQED